MTRRRREIGLDTLKRTQPRQCRQSATQIKTLIIEDILGKLKRKSTHPARLIAKNSNHHRKAVSEPSLGMPAWLDLRRIRKLTGQYF